MREFNISQEVTDVDAFLSLPVEEVARLVLQDQKPAGSLNNSLGVGLTDYVNKLFPDKMSSDNWLYGGERREEVCIAVAEAWGWLTANGLLAPHPLRDGKYVPTRRAEETSKPGGFEHYRNAAQIPWSLMHPTLRDFAKSDLLRGKFSGAISESFKKVEIAVREAGEYPPRLLGTELMNAAFRPEVEETGKKDVGKLTDTSLHRQEQKGMQSLFVGAMSYLRNPHSHRDVPIEDIIEAVEIIMFASHLLRIVDGRRKKGSSTT